MIFSSKNRKAAKHRAKNGLKPQNPKPRTPSLKMSSAAMKQIKLPVRKCLKSLLSSPELIPRPLIPPSPPFNKIFYTFTVTFTKFCSIILVNFEGSNFIAFFVINIIVQFGELIK